MTRDSASNPPRRYAVSHAR